MINNEAASLENHVVIDAYDMSAYDEEIKQFYSEVQKQSPSQKLRSAATFFLDKPYLLEALGEGREGKYDQQPLYRTDKFDCVTYVDTVLALYRSQNLTAFKKNILLIRYRSGIINYCKRTDWFTDLEWLPNVEQLGWITNRTKLIVERKGEAIWQLAETEIDKPNWYRVKTHRSLRLLKNRPAQLAAQLLAELQAERLQFVSEVSTLDYLPFTCLFDDKNHPNDFLFSQFPSAGIIVIVRPNWPIKNNFPNFPQGYGTNLNVSHLGFIFRNQKELIFYHAAIGKKVEQIPLIAYLQACLANETIKGIHIEEIT